MADQLNSTAIEQLPEGMTYRKVKMSPELMKEWASRDEDCNRLTWNWGEPDADGFYTPIVEVRYDDNPLAALVEEAKSRERDVENLTPGGSEFVSSWDNCIGFVQERMRVAGKVAAERNRLRKALEEQEALLREVACSGHHVPDPRIDWVDVQVDRDTWAKLRERVEAATQSEQGEGDR